MLILAGVTISIVVNGGLFNQAQNAANATQNAAADEQALTVAVAASMLDPNGDDLFNSVKNAAGGTTFDVTDNGDGTVTLTDSKTGLSYIIDADYNVSGGGIGSSTNGKGGNSNNTGGNTGNTSGGTNNTGGNDIPENATIAELFNNDNTGTIKVGDYVAYMPDSVVASYVVQGQYSTSNSGANQTANRESLSWRVLDKTSDGKLRLISASPTTFSLTLQGANGYNNAVKLIDDLCAMYGGSKGTAQGLKLNDVLPHLLSRYHVAYNPTPGLLGHQGGYSVPTSLGINYPSIFGYENNQMSNSQPMMPGPVVGLLPDVQDTWYTGTKSSSSRINSN